MKNDDYEAIEEQEQPEPPPAAAVGRRLNRAFGPIVAGMFIDLLDLATFGPIGYVLGLPVGGLAGYWMGRCLGLSRTASLTCALAAGIYCTIPFTGILPLGTLVGAYVRFRESGRETLRDEAPAAEAETGDDA
jgi:hypothetical protein